MSTTATLGRTPRATGRARPCALCGRPASFSGVISTHGGQVTVFGLCGVHACVSDDVILRGVVRWAERERSPGPEA